MIGGSATSNEKLMYIEKLIYTANHKIYQFKEQVVKKFNIIV